MPTVAARPGRRREWMGVAITLAILAAASFIWTGNARAADVKGWVIDQDGDPVPGATVQLDPVLGEWEESSPAGEADRYVTTTSLKSGWYELQTVMPGRYRLSCGGSSFREIYVGVGTLQEDCQQ